MRGVPLHVDDIDNELLLRLWFDDNLRKCDVAKALGVSASWITRNQARLGLPPRAYRRPPPMEDPTPEQIAERAAECRAARVKKRADLESHSASPYRTECLAWDGSCFSVRNA